MLIIVAELSPGPVPLDVNGVPHPYDDLEAVLEGANWSIHGTTYGLAIAASSLAEEVLRKRAAVYPRRIAIGAKEAWAIFPEYRAEFRGKIERWTLDGVAHGELRLADTIIDDSLLGLRLKLGEYQPSEITPSVPGEKLEEFTVDPHQLNPFEYLNKNEVCEKISVEGKYLFFCDYFSVSGSMGKDLIPGVKFLSPHALHAHTDFDDIRKALALQHTASGFSRNFDELMPRQFMGVLVADCPDQNYVQVIVRRVLAAAAFAGTAYGKVLGFARLTKGSLQASRVTEFGTRPYCDNSLPNKNIIRADNQLYREILELVAIGSAAKLAAGKEDYRLLALDVVEDARRSNVSTLAYAQLWMAIEKLLSINNEISAQISLALTAFSPAAERVNEFDKLKKGYDLRSRIVHGYSFKAKDFEVCPAKDVARLFRLLFLTSLKYSDTSELAAAMRSHVLSGVGAAIQDQ